MAATFEVVVYRDGTSAVTELDRDEDGRETYVGRDFHDVEATRRIVHALGKQRVLAPSPLNRPTYVEARAQG